MKQPKGFNESKAVSQEGAKVAKVAKDARKNIESRTGKSAISPLNAKELPGRKDNINQLKE